MVASATQEKVYNVQLASDPREPKSYKEALASPKQANWLVAIKNESENFINQKEWTPTEIQTLGHRQKPIKVKWVFKKKAEQDGSTCFKGQIVVKGFVQIPGVDFTNTHSPVAQDSSLQIILAIVMFLENGWPRCLILK